MANDDNPGVSMTGRFHSRLVLAFLPIALGALLCWTSAEPASAQDGARLDGAGLGAMLGALPYKAKSLGPGAYEVTAGDSKRPCVLRAALGKDGSLIWIFALMAEVKDSKSVSREALLRMLAANQTFGPSFLSIGPDGDTPKYVYFNRTIANQGITKESLTTAIDNFCADADSIAAMILSGSLPGP
jgi:hypothetical protein